MAKKAKKKEIVPKYDESREDVENNVYLFHNVKENLHFFTNGTDLDDACNQFDKAEFHNRGQWKIFVECGHQPSDGPST